MLHEARANCGLFEPNLRRLLELILLSGLAGLRLTCAQESPPAEPEVAPIWDQSFDFHFGFGYTDNVLLADTTKRSTAFTVAGLDAALFRVSLHGPELSLFVSGEDRRFLGNVGVDKDETWIAVGKIQREVTSEWRIALSLQYLYQDQVFDVSATEAELLSIQLKGHGLKATPSVAHQLAGGYQLRMEWPVTRQFLAKPLDDYWEDGPRLTLEKTYGKRSTASVSYGYAERFYDERPRVDRAGASIAGTDLRLRRHELELADRHYWDDARNWRSETKLGFESNTDNGSKYFGYDRFRISEQLRYTGSKWNLQAGARVSFYNYTAQMADPPSGSRRHVMTLSWTLRTEINMTKSFQGFLELARDQNSSNRAANEYQAVTVSSGINWEF